MRAVVQRSVGASVVVAGETVAAFEGEGLVVLVGATHDDEVADCDYIARKVAELRILRDERSAVDVSAPVIVVSQFTLYADVRKGRRPSWNGAAPGSVAEPLVDEVVTRLRERGLNVGTGVFGADMRVTINNDGPVTIWLDSSGG
ncbi:D-tyrosyl-tRNA(Tyr) deacylase [Micrococcales bacterium KH10]|nr:D-tyrosyl-tRNA(Tyr) deacylase [Micrococcales bacterium KH10]